MIGGNEVARLVAGLPERAILVLDGAYAEFVDGFDGGAKWASQRDNVVHDPHIFQALRPGRVAHRLGLRTQNDHRRADQVRGPFNLSHSQQDTARAALLDRDHAEKTRSENARLRVWLADALAQVGVPSDTSSANFILARFGDRAEAEACDDFPANPGPDRASRGGL